MPTVVRFMINIDPHYHEATFDCPYQDITANDVLDVAPRVCMDFYHLQTSGLPPPKELARRETYRLHYITDQATAFNLDQAYQARYDIRPAQRSNPDVLKQALGWYRAMGHYLTSEYTEPTSKLESKAPPDTTVVRCMISPKSNRTPPLSLPNGNPQSHPAPFPPKRHARLRSASSAPAEA
ncbi:hypothetical protein GSI_02692 [Ganoderma sinense ZZ0214-1]|uniref:Uncharacterized protein n=1 Tax=Ganoderma sinense ZZ0214-1 TaxID=1077348 RepID=A0A2G8SMB4_9APHY|nr:hypothetical protein GSI_02692 [Ganoderma sinense ZZ0214-1]